MNWLRGRGGDDEAVWPEETAETRTIITESILTDTQHIPGIVYRVKLPLQLSKNAAVTVISKPGPNTFCQRWHTAHNCLLIKYCSILLFLLWLIFAAWSEAKKKSRSITVRSRATAPSSIQHTIYRPYRTTNNWLSEWVDVDVDVPV